MEKRIKDDDKWAELAAGTAGDVLIRHIFYSMSTHSCGIFNLEYNKEIILDSNTTTIKTMKADVYGE